MSSMNSFGVILCTLVLTWWSPAEGSFFVASSYESRKKYICVTNTSSALTWIHEGVFDRFPETSRYVPKPIGPYSCNTRDDFCTRNYFSSQSWSLQYSYNQIILDERWEEMAVTETRSFYDPGKRLRFEPVLEIKKNDFNISLSIRTEKEGHIFLCDGETPSDSNCYWFMLQGFNGNMSAIRKCSKGEIPSEDGRKPKGSCSTRRQYEQHPTFPGYLSKSRWSHFMITKSNGLIRLSVYSGNKLSKYLEWQDPEVPIVVTNMIVHSKIVDGLWKIHILDFMYTTDQITEVSSHAPPIYTNDDFLCISLYVWMCKSCRIKLSLKATDRIINEITYEPEHSGWNRLKWITKNISRPLNMQLLISTIGESENRYWAINKIRFCREEEFRVIRTNREATCQLMSGTLNLIKFEEKSVPSKSNCREDTIGPFCAKCDLFFNNCERLTICTEDQCVCSAGYSDQYCYYDCNTGRYGHGCQKSCGKCQYGCDNKDGRCQSSLCLDNYSGAKCDIPPSAIFTKPPEVSSITYNGATIKVFDLEITNTGYYNRPQFYKIQYKKSKLSDFSWIDFKKNFTFNVSAVVKLNNLDPETQYMVRSVVVSTHATFQMDEKVKFTEFTTSCIEIEESNIAIKAFKTNASIALVPTKKFTCKSYTFSLDEVANGAFYKNGNIYFTKLEPSTRYTLRVQGKNKTYTKQFVTAAEEISEAPSALKLDWTLGNDLVAEWKQPRKTNGKIEYFDFSVTGPDQTRIVRERIYIPDGRYNLSYRYQVNSTQVRPGTKYKITVFAFNGREGVNVSAHTTGPPEIPVLAEDPVLHISQHTVEMIMLLKDLQEASDNYRVIVLRSDKETSLNSYKELQDFDLRNLRVLIDCSFTNVHNYIVLILGQHQRLANCQDTDNSVLEPATSYNVTIILMNTFHNMTRTKIYSLEIETEGEANSALFGLFALLLIVPAVALWYRKRRRRAQPVLGINNIGQPKVTERTDQVPLIHMQPKAGKNIPIKNTAEGPTHHSKQMAVRNFANYFKTALQTQELKKQYESILETVLTYETVIVDSLRSDFVDMNFTSGAQIKNAYIITKLPTMAEFNEFWKVVVDENINDIVLFTHLHPTQKKSKNYWPDVGKSLHCGNVIVECNMSQKYTFYSRRKFSLKCRNKVRKVHQLHLSLPPNDNRYLSSLNYVQFFKELLKIPLSSKSPILVQSSSGMRGICFALLCDMSLRSAQKDGTIDVMAIFKTLVQTTTEMKIEFDHYVAAHAIIADTLNHLDTGVASISIDYSKSELFTREEIKKHLQYLKDTLWLDQIVIEEENGCYVNCPTILLKSERRDVQISSDHHSQSEQPDFIKVGGFKTPGKFWVAKQPVSTPFNDFLEKVQERKISVIVTLNDNIFTWPNEDHPELTIGSDVTLKYKFIKKLKFYDWITLELTTKTTSQIVEVVTFKKWPAPVVSLPNVEDFVNFVKESNEIFQNTEPVLVTCHDGRTSCGLYLAMSYSVQQIKTENICDVCTCVRAIRRHGQGFVKDDEQYIFLVEAAHNYMKEFSLYEVK